MAEEEQDMAEEKAHIRKSREYRRFKKLLKQVIEAPPMRSKVNRQKAVVLQAKEQ